MDERQDRIAALLDTLGADYAVLTAPDSVAYATGHIVPIEAGPAPFAGGPTTAFVTRDGTTAIVAANLETAAAEASRADIAELYTGFAYQEAPDRHAAYLDAVTSAARRIGLTGTAAIEPHSQPAALTEALAPAATLPVTDALARIRATKTEAEIVAMRRAAEIAATGQRAVRQAVRAGITELDAFAAIRAAMENAAGERLPVTGDFLSGPARTAGFTGWPTDRLMKAGDPVLSDLAPRVAGYWGDSCASGMIGGASPAYRPLFDTALTALKHARDILRPGLALSRLDAELRGITRAAGFDYPHHTGHSLGTSVHEWPRIVPYETATAEPGMVLMIEPGCYDPEIGGVRTEWMFLVTETGCEVLTDFDQDPLI